jgi:hypothetical protein
MLKNPAAVEHALLFGETDIAFMHCHEIMHRPNTHRTRLTPELLENKCTHPRMAQDALPSSTPFLSATKSTDRQADTHAALDGCVCTHCCMQLQMSLGSIFPFLPLSRHHPPVPICATIHNHFPD